MTLRTSRADFVSGTAAQLAAGNPIRTRGTITQASDTGVIAIADGVTAYNSLEKAISLAAPIAITGVAAAGSAVKSAITALVTAGIATDSTTLT